MPTCRARACGSLRVVKTSGEVIEFSRHAPARIVGNQVVGRTRVEREREVEIEGPFRLIERRVDGTPEKVADAKGRVWSVRKVLKEEPNRMTILAAGLVTDSVAIPLSEVRQIKIRRPNAALSILAVLVVAGAANFAVVICYISRWKIDEARPRIRSSAASGDPDRVFGEDLIEGSHENVRVGLREAQGGRILMTLWSGPSVPVRTPSSRRRSTT